MFTVIPAIDILNGKCVRLIKGDYTKETIYNDNPLEIAQQWEKMGAKRIHIVDLDGAKAGKPINQNIIKNIAKKVSCQIEVGGGIRSFESIKGYLASDIDYVILGSIIFKDLPLFHSALTNFGNKIIAGVDLENGFAKASGWLENTKKDGLTIIKQLKKFGTSSVICTDIAKDGMLVGPNLKLYQDLSKSVDLEIIASGGISSLKDIKNLQKIKNISGCIIGKALYENKIDLVEALKLQK
ncbi:MAG: 1-(5-phosphoribosyl)-5-[(5-phosphoribosylamino)methylideneamino]imidazole-4-carboxamide isomerase [Candidatus Margulisbacteria bacterium]|nr:1-(5-phosphoribosyl)-5-[(5-phosphoribosylamino)methylideneamino]imidazole-4-carboxamide isomerase [Candidatus Margulisiibacteriota bacterium]